MSDIRLTADTSGAIRSIDRLESSIGDLQSRFGKLGQTVSGINGSFSKLGGSVGKVTAAMAPLNSAIAGLGIAAFITQTIAMADAMADLSDSTGIAMNELIGFSDAVSLSGGDAAKAEKAVLKLVQNIGDAADGSAELQKAFGSVNVSLGDLANLSEGDILKKTVEGLSKIDDASARSVLAAKLLGKEFRNVGISQLNEMLGKTTAEASKSAKAFENAAKAQEKFDIAINTMRKSALLAIEPLTKLIAELKPEQIEKFVGKIEKLNEIAKNFTGLFTAIDGLKWAFENLGESPGKVGAAFAAVVGTFVVLATKAGAIVSGISTAFSNLVPMIVSFGSAIGRAFAGALPIISKVVGALTAPLAVLVTINEAIKLAFKVDPIMDFWKGLVEITKYLGKVLGLYESISGKKIEAATVEAPIIPEYSNEGRTGKRDYDFKAPEKGPKREVKVIDEFAKQKTALKEISKIYALQNTEMNTAAGLQKSLLMMSEDQREETTAIYELDKQRRTVINDLQAKLRDLSPEEAKAGLGKIILDQIKNVNGEYLKQLPIVRQSVTDLQTIKLLEQDRLTTNQNIVDAINKQIERESALADIIRGINDKQVDLKFETGLKGLDPYKAEIARINEEARKGALEAGRSLASQYEDSGDGLNPDDAVKLANGLDQIAQKYKGIADAQIANLNAGRTWSTGWDTAFNEYADSATNAAEKAKDAFSSVTSNMDKMIDTFVTTGKFAFGDFAKSVIQDLIKIELKAQAMELMKMMGGGGNIMGTLSSFIGGFFAEGGQPPLNKASIVGERGPELFVPKSAGTIIPNGQFGGGGSQTVINNNTYVTNSVSAIDAKSVAQLFQENRRTLLGVTDMARKEMPGRTR